MIRSISISHIKGIREGTLSNLTPIVVLVGPNNSGKSTILRAIEAVVSQQPQQTLLQSMQLSGVSSPLRWMLWTSNGDYPSNGRIKATFDNEFDRVITVGFSTIGDPNSGFQFREEIFLAGTNTPTSRQAGLTLRKGLPSSVFIDALADRDKPLAQILTEAAERGTDTEAKELIYELLPNVIDIQILSPGNAPAVYLRYRDGARPVVIEGDGIQALLRIIFSLSLPRGTIVMLEEPEVRLHPAAIRQIARALLAAANRGLQLFITTHSLDLIDALLAYATPEQMPQLTFCRLQLSQGNLTAVSLSGEEASVARTQIQDDLR